MEDKKSIGAVSQLSFMGIVRAIRCKSGTAPTHNSLTGLFASIPQPISRISLFSRFHLFPNNNGGELFLPLETKNKCPILHSMQHLLQAILHSSFSDKKIEVHILCLHLLHPIISGNKWMKLQPYIHAAVSNKQVGVISKGGPWSNHLHAAAYASMQSGLNFKAVLQTNSNIITTTLKDVEKWGGKLLYTTRELYKNETYWATWAEEHNYQYIPMGGEGAVGIQGVSTYINQLAIPGFSHIIVPVGTGTTMLGIAHSQLQFNQLVGINPGITDSGFLPMVTRLEKDFPARKFAIMHEPALLKFGKHPDFLLQEMNNWYRKWQIPTDIVYTAKMVYLFEKLVAENYFEQGSKVLLVHTGGLQGNQSLPEGTLIF